MSSKHAIFYAKIKRYEEELREEYAYDSAMADILSIDLSTQFYFKLVDDKPVIIFFDNTLLTETIKHEIRILYTLCMHS